MKNLIVILILLLAFSIQAQTSLKGTWNTGESNTKIEISNTNGAWIGKLKSSDNKKTEIGKVILKDLKKDSNQWTDKIYVIKRKQWYHVELDLQAKVLELNISVGFLSKTLAWNKVEE